MADNKNNVSYMTNYLRYALEFEKNVYIWTETMNVANRQMQYIYDKRNEEIIKKQNIRSALESVDVSDSYKYTNQENRIKKLIKIKKSVLIISIIFLIFLFAVGCIIGYFSQNNILGALLYGYVTLVAGSLATGIFPILIVVYIFCYIKLKKAKNDSINVLNENNLQENKNNLCDQEIEVELNLAELDIDEETLITQQEEISKALNEARTTLLNIYNMNVLPNKYRSFAAVATLYEYLSTGRCNTIQGHGGIYDTYETEKIQIEQLNQLILMNQTLQRIEDYQRCIYKEMQKANQTLKMIRYDLESIGKSLDGIETNSAISAHANQQSAASLSWLSWNEWSKN